jgi:parvulin-like peptidyl-prolyl isomerase
MARLAAFFVGSVTAAALCTPTFAVSRSRSAAPPRARPRSVAAKTPAVAPAKPAATLTRKNVWKAPPRTPVALVNGEPITVAQWEDRVALMAGQSALEALLNEALLRQEARKQGVRVTPAEINTAIDQQLKSIRGRVGTEAQFQELLKQKNMTIPGLREIIALQQEPRLLSEKLREKVTASITVADADIAAAYEAQKLLYKVPEEARISHILIPVAGADPAVDAAAKAKAEALLGRAKEMTAEQFAELAKETSEDPDTKAKGGELPSLRRPTFFGPAFDNAVFGGMPGLVPELVRSFRGYHIVFLHSKTPARVKPLDEVKPQLQEQLLNQRRAGFFKNYMDALLKNAKQEVRLKN